LNARFYGKDKKMDISRKEQLDQIIEELKQAEYQVTEIKKGERTKKAPLPFTTSTMQQEAANALNFATQKTMRIAQQLYEGVEIKGKGSIGLITYLRTDSVRVSEEALTASAAYIGTHYGEAYVSHEQPAGKKNSNNVQDAHEAIRPTDLSLTPAAVKESLARDQFRLYQLIWQRFVASRMTPAVFETNTVKISAGAYVFQTSASRRIFDGYQSVYDSDSDKKDNQAAVAALQTGAILPSPELEPLQHFTQSQPHYTEASLVHELEEEGIGRPSTYAPTITTLLGRRYLIKDQKNLYVTELGEVVNNIMEEAFPTIVNVAFTANMESLLDGVAEGEVDWKAIVRNFYPDLDEAVEKAEKELEEVKIEDEVSDVPCDICGRMMVIKYGPHGKFLACPGFPECRNTKPLLEKIGVPCPKCGKDVILRRTKKGRRYYGCIGNGEDCDFMSWQKPSTQKCPVCGGYMVEKGNKLVCADANCGTTMDHPDRK
jgi:DNA topoisomerase-1